MDLTPQWGSYRRRVCARLSYLLSSSFGWFLLSRFLSMRSDRSCLRTAVAYSISPCSAVMMREATLPRSRMEKDLCASKVRMKVSRKCFLVRSWPNNVRAFSTFAGTWTEGDKGGKERVTMAQFHCCRQILHHRGIRVVGLS